ncbi:hypothetical protein BDB00DRAFT_798767 [Zychaea mexicana]|uniref:uncharacterized protein n=1 Tax=Zychaea mexicana TaxID=64656 RepID=UPI0022FEEB94|nr:uncharacterized protein BDB00DRAFT_798767 [Zychaea mexicana]KAI9498626.1 hypothetical protein BDB00DRAFT_798767 [Zychaea mexicana]
MVDPRLIRVYKLLYKLRYFANTGVSWGVWLRYLLIGSLFCYITGSPWSNVTVLYIIQMDCFYAIVLSRLH